MVRPFTYILLGVLLSLGLFSCSGTDVTFAEPQPAGVKETPKFKYKFRGKYLCLEDSSILKISKTEIIQYWNVAVDVDSIGANKNSIKNIHVDTENGDLNVTSSTDSSQVQVDYTHEVFVTGGNDVLKYHNGVYYLNEMISNMSWELKIMFFNNASNLVIKDAHLSPNDIESLKNYTEVLEIGDMDGNITGYYIQPTVTELEKLIHSDIFTEEQEFIRY